jgi:hypothetical protein
MTGVFDAVRYCDASDAAGDSGTLLSAGRGSLLTPVTLSREESVGAAILVDTLMVREKSSATGDSEVEGLILEFLSCKGDSAEEIDSTSLAF